MPDKTWTVTLVDGKPEGWYTDPIPPRSATCGVPGHPETGHGGHPDPEYTCTQQLLDRQEREIARLRAELEEAGKVIGWMKAARQSLAEQVADRDAEIASLRGEHDG
jgi:hypothetical protein